MIPAPRLQAVLTQWEDLSALDWPRLAAEHGGICQLVAGRVPVDAGLPAAWRQQVVVEALGHLGSLQLIQGWHLPFLVVKGIAWGAALWGEATARPARDLDLVIKAGDLPEWRMRLQEAGFTAPRGPTEWLRGRQIVQLHFPGSRGSWLHRVQPPWEAFWRRAQPLVLEAVEIQTLDPADTLLYLAHHQVFRHAFEHDLGWLDLAGWLRWAPPDATVNAVRRSAGTHLAGSLAVLAWAWHRLGQTGLADVPPMPWTVSPWAHRAWARPGDWRTAVPLALVLARGPERRALLSGAPQAWSRWRDWRARTD